MSEIKVTVVPLREEDGWHKCPRCRNYTHEGAFNFKNLCDRCSRVLVEAHPDHPWAPDILKNREQQREMWTAKEKNHAG